MHTGYGNFWMYQNNRHEPVLCLSKNDNYSHAVLTDSYKPVSNGGCPNHLNSYPISQNVASSQQSDQLKMTGSQYVWPSSVYSLTFRSSYASNVQLPETCSNQSSNLDFTTQKSQQNCNLGHLRNTNLSFPEMFANTNKSNKYYSNPVQTQNNKNTVTPLPRIRVKDVFSLNNSVLHNSLKEDNLFQTNQKEQLIQNYAPVSHFTSYNSKTPVEFMDFEKINLLKSSYLVPPYGPTAADQLLPYDHQQFCQQNTQLSTESQFQFNSTKEIEKNLPSKVCKTDSLIRKFHDSEKIQDADIHNVQRHSCSALYNSRGERVQSKKNSGDLINLQNLETVCSYVNTEKSNNTFYSDSFEANENIIHSSMISNKDAQNQSHCLKNLSKIDEANSFCYDSFTKELKKRRKSTQVLNPKNSLHDKTERQENNLIKITIPHTGQSSFIHLPDSSSIERHHSLNLPCSLESKNQLLCALNKKRSTDNQTKIEKDEVVNLSSSQASQDSSVSTISSDANQVCSISSTIKSNHDTEVEKNSFDETLMSSPKKLEFSKENLNLNLKKHVDINNQENYVFHKSEESFENIREELKPKNSIEDDTKSTDVISHNSTTSETVIVKQDLCLKIDSPLEQFIPESQVKTERNFETFSLQKHLPELPPSQNLNTSKETHHFETSNTEKIVSNEFNMGNTFDSQKIGIKSKTRSIALKNSGNRVQKLDTTENNSDKKNNFPAKENIENSEVDEKKVNESTEKYKSKINRKKLDLLIQFLKKDEETVEGSDFEEKDPLLMKNTDCSNKEEKVPLNHSRRKLSKTRIVKNKNESREMLSLISNKIPRVEILKCSSKTPQIVQTNKTSNRSKERSEEVSLVVDKSFDVLVEECKATDIPLQEYQTQKDSTKSEEINVFLCKNDQDTLKKVLSVKECDVHEEESVINIMRTFQNLKTHFCMSCDLASSVESFWINAVTGELRCLNCFKKMMLKIEEDVLKSKAESSDDKNSLEANSIQKDQINRGNESKKENICKTAFENQTNDRDGLINITKYDCDHWKSNDLDKNFKQELKEIRNEIDENYRMKIKETDDKITIKKSNEFCFISERCKVNLVDSSNVSRRQSVSTENIASLSQKSKELSPKVKLLVNYREEKLSDQFVRRNNSKEPTVINSTQVSEEGIKPELIDSSKKSKRENISNEEYISKEFIKIEKKKTTDWKKKRSNSKEKYISQKVQNSEEHSKREIKVTATLDKSIIKRRSEENSACQNTHDSEGNIKKNTKQESRNNLKVQNDSKEHCSDKQQKTSELIKTKETDLAEESKRKSLSAQNFTEKRKKLGYTDQSRKRKNSEESFIVYKVRVKEEHTKRDTSKELIKEDRVELKNSMLEHEKQNVRDYGEKSRKNSFSKEECINFGDFSKKETKQMSDSSDKMKTKCDLHSQKTKTSEHFKYKRNDSSEIFRKKKNAGECIISKSVTMKEYSKNEIRKSVESLNKLRRISISKKDFSVPKRQAPVSEHFKNGNLSSEIKECKKMEEKERKPFGGKIPKKLHRFGDECQ